MKSFAPIVIVILVITGAFAFSTAHAQTKDSVAVVQVNPLECCYQLFLFNTHTPAGNINGLAVEIITPDVEFIPGINGGPWPPMSESMKRFEWGIPDDGLPSGEALDPFDVCFEYLGGGPRPLQMVWETSFNGALVSTDTVLVDCQPLSPVCDSLRVFSVSPSGQPDESCAYGLRLVNLHANPPSGLNDLHILLMTPGASFVGTASGPWDVDAQTATELVFRSADTALASGDSLEGFTFYVRTPDGLQGTLDFQWWSSFDGGIVCPGEFTTNCTPIEYPRCDSLFAQKQGECQYNFGFANLHKPRGLISGYRMSVITPGANFTSVTAPPGWQISSQTALNVRLAAVTPVSYGTIVRGIRTSLKPSNSGVMRVAVSTTLDDQIVCKDTLTLICQPPEPEYCDSLLTARMEGDCVWNLGFVNKHLPATDVEDFHVSLQTPGAEIDSAQAPEGWMITGRSATTVSFKTTSATVPPDSTKIGFLLSFIPGPDSKIVEFEWCSSLADTTLCCELAALSCEPPEIVSDTLIVSAGAEHCTYDLGFANLHEPRSAVNDFHVRLLTPDALLLDVQPPQGWSLDSSTASSAHFSATSGSVASGGSATGFMFDLVPSANSREIVLEWSTTLDGTATTVDTASVFCDIITVRCDSVDVTTNIEQPCCFDFSLRNSHLPFSPLNDFHVIVLTPDVILYPSTVQSPDAWDTFTTGSSVTWQRNDGDIQPGDLLDGFAVCFDNDATGNQDFRILWQSTFDGIIVCQDTLLVKCDRTLDVERLDGSLPGDFSLEQNYPNPFNPVTTIEFAVPYESDVDLALYDMNGRLLRDLGSGTYTPGRYRVAVDLSALPSGTYIYRMRAAGRDLSRRMLLLK